MSKEKLLKLEKENKYVFHGSPVENIDLLEPRQARHYPDLSNHPEEYILDGDPAVSATPYAEIAIFRALINSKNIHTNHRSGFDVMGGKPNFRLSSKEIIKELEGKKGFVYVFDRSNFKPYRRDGEAVPESMEWRSYKEVKPLEVVEVWRNDFPSEDRVEIIK